MPRERPNSEKVLARAKREREEILVGLVLILTDLARQKANVTARSRETMDTK